MAPFKVAPLITDIPNPRVKARINEVITSIKGGIITVKYGTNGSTTAASTGCNSASFNSQG